MPNLDDINDNNLRSNANEILVGENDHSASIGLIRQAFIELTEKSETLDESFRKPYQIKFDDIEQLHQKVFQTINQYNVISKICDFLFII